MGEDWGGERIDVSSTTAVATHFVLVDISLSVHYHATHLIGQATKARH